MVYLEKETQMTISKTQEDRIHLLVFSSILPTLKAKFILYPFSKKPKGCYSELVLNPSLESWLDSPWQVLAQKVVFEATS